MAWYRAGGGGIPSFLKTDMNAVLNKKFGTSQDYPPTDWAPSVNLLGPLPEKTASGSVANITDGADGVPLKSWDVTVDANLDGVSSIKATQAGKNLVDGSNFTKGLPATTIGSSINTISSSDRYSYFGCDIKGGSYNISSVSTDSDYYNAILIFGYSGGFLSVYTAGVVNGNKTVDLSACDYVRVCIGTRGVGYSVPTDFSSYGTIQLEIGSYTSYAAYTAPTITTVPLGRTIYGGSADIVTGEGVETHKGYTLDNLTWSGSVFDGNWVWYTDLSADGLKIPFASEVFSGICDTYTPINYSGVSSNTNTIALRQNGSLYVNNGSNETEPTGKVTIELDTPTDFTFTPITPTPETALGVNNFWADEGDSEITYRADIDLALSALGGRGLSMMRPVNTEEIEFEEEENR